MTLSARIRSEREKRGLSQARLGELVGVDNNTISRWERGVFKITSDYVPRLATALETTVAYLMGEKDETSTINDEALKSLHTGLKVPIRNKSQASADLETMIRDMAAEHPDLIVLFRDTRERWGELTEKEKRAIADGMAFVLGRADAEVESRLRKEGRRGPI